MRTKLGLIAALFISPLALSVENNSGFELTISGAQAQQPSSVQQSPKLNTYQIENASLENSSVEVISPQENVTVAQETQVNVGDSAQTSNNPSPQTVAMLAPVTMGAVAANTAINVANSNAAQVMPQDNSALEQEPSLEDQSQESASLVVPLNLELKLDESILEAFKDLIAKRTLGSSLDPNYEDAALALNNLYEQNGTLVAEFSTQAVDDFINTQGLSVFDGLSNPILVWMVNYSDTASSLVSGENVTAFADALMQDAQSLNYRLMLPLMDLDDVQKVNVNTILMHNDALIAKASERYGCDYFLTMAVEDNNGLGTVKWNLYTKDATRLIGSDVSGVTSELATLTAGDIARTLASLSGNPKPGQAQEEVLASKVDIFDLGPGDGFVRMKIDNVQSLKDLKAIERSLVSYGYDAGYTIQGFDNGSLILEIETSSDPTILDGTMARARDFTKLDSWHYALNNSTKTSKSFKGLGPKDLKRPDSQVQRVTTVNANPVALEENQP